MYIFEEEKHPIGKIPNVDGIDVHQLDLKADLHRSRRAKKSLDLIE